MMSVTCMQSLLSSVSAWLSSCALVSIGAAPLPFEAPALLPDLALDDDEDLLRKVTAKFQTRVDHYNAAANPSALSPVALPSPL